MLMPVVGYHCGTCVEELRNIAKGSATSVWFCFLLPVGNNVTECRQTIWENGGENVLKLLMQRRKQLFANGPDKRCLLQSFDTSHRLIIKQESVHLYFLTNKIRTMFFTYLNIHDTKIFLTAVDTKYSGAYEWYIVTNIPFVAISRNSIHSLSMRRRTVDLATFPVTCLHRNTIIIRIRR